VPVPACCVLQSRKLLSMHVRMEDVFEVPDAAVGIALLDDEGVVSFSAADQPKQAGSRVPGRTLSYGPHSRPNPPSAGVCGIVCALHDDGS